MSLQPPTHWPLDETPEDRPFNVMFYVNRQTGVIECVADMYPRLLDTWLTFPLRNVCTLVPPRNVPDMVESFRANGQRIAVERVVNQIVESDATIRGDATRVKALPPQLDMAFPGEHRLYEFQRKTIDFCLARRGRFLIADEPGLGKTIQAIACAVYMASFPVLIVCPANVKYQWPEEIKAWTGISAQVVEGGKGFQQWMSPWVVINWDILANNYENLTRVPWGCIIADEIHYAKKPKSARSQALRALARKTRRFIGLTGTPITNAPRDLWSQLDAIEPDKWGTSERFAVAFNGAKKKDQKHWKMGKPTNVPTLHAWLNEVMLRRKKDEVGLHLPSKQRSTIAVPLSPEAWSMYEQARQAFIAQMRTDEITKEQFQLLIPHLHKARQAASWGRLWATVQKAIELTETEPIVIFAYYKESVQYLTNALRQNGRNVALIDGSVPSKRREEIKQGFQSGQYHALVGQINAASTGMNLQRAKFTLHHEVTWVPTESKQCEDRINRIGSTDKTTHIYYAAQGTIDERMIQVNAEKLAASDAILDSGQNITGSILSEVLWREFGLRFKESVPAEALA